MARMTLDPSSSSSKSSSSSTSSSSAKSAKASSKSGAGMSSADKKKLGAAVGLLVLAGLIVGYFNGLFDSLLTSTPKGPTPEEIQALQDLERQQKEAEKQYQQNPKARPVPMGS